MICNTCKNKLLKKDQYLCTNCKNIFCGSHIGQYVDESNCNITKNSPYLCRDCYFIRYKEY